MKFFVTGGAGFIGSNFVHYILDNYKDDEVFNYDLLTYAGNLENIKKWQDNERYNFIQGDIGDYEKLMKIFKTFKPDAVVNFAAESHNDRGETNPRIFVETNVLGTEILLEAVRDSGIPRFHHISTCEVFGDLPLEGDLSFTEESKYNPKTPYNASKAGSDHIAKAFFHTFDVPVTISNCANNYGPYQFPEKVLPLFITNALEGKPLPLFKSSLNKREWSHAEDHCRAIDLIVRNGKPGETYNVGSGVEKTVEEIADAVLQRLNLDDSLKTYVPDRRQHDRRYLLDSSKLKRELGWVSLHTFEDGINETIDWYVNNPEWWKPIKNGEKYKDYYSKKYSSLN